MADLNRSVDECDRSLQLAPKDRVERAGRLNNFGLALRVRFEVTGALRDSDRAINPYEEAALATQLHMTLALTLGNLANALAQRVERTHLMQDLRCAIENYEKLLR